MIEPVRYQTIVVPLDGSTLAEWALPAALSLARRHDATIELVTVDIVVPTMSVTPALAALPVEPSDALSPAAYLAEMAQRLAALHPGIINRTVTRGHSRAADGLLRQARKCGADLIVMGTHGRGHLKRMWLGSTADGVARRSRIPTLLIQPSADERVNLSQAQEFQRILVPLDGSAASASILPHSIALGDAASAQYTLYGAVLPSLGFGPDSLPTAGVLAGEILQIQNQRTRQYLDHTAEPLRQHGLRVQTRTDIEISAADGILKCAENWPADLITLTTHGHGGALRLLLGSVADKVVRGARVPVLLYRPPTVL
jgi:nucleotide-binding universal stress UspA family protein